MTDWIVEDHKGWGDRISFSGSRSDHHKWDGHLTPTPRVGDRFVTETMSGKTMAFKVIECHVPTDPGDQFFAKTERTGVPV